MSKKISVVLALVLTVAMLSMSALACTSFYVGSDLTTDGTFYFGRSEDYSNSYNKLYEAIPAGVHKAGDTYVGCYGFTYEFTHDSYSYTAFRDDNGAGVDYVCPDCGETHTHTPYQAAGTNSMGVSMSATETLGGSKAARAADPMNGDTGIEEAEIPTVILSEAATAREGVELLCSIYDNVGAQGGSGIFIADANECWYIENVSGHQYIAIKLSSSMAMTDPNMSVIGLIDLDDTDNVIASPALISTAVENGFFVGDEAANTIDYRASYNADATVNSRMIQILPTYSAENAKEEYVNEDFCISNVDAEGNIVAMYTNIAVDHPYTIADMVNLWHLSTVGSGRSTETHIFAISGEGATGTMEWVAVNDPSVQPFVPYYPMLTTDVYAAYKLSTAKAVKTQEAPEAGVAAYATTFNVRNEAGERVSVDGYCVLPENWAESVYWTVDVLSHCTAEEDKAALDAAVAELQNLSYLAADQMIALVAEAEDPAAVATECSAIIAEAMHAGMVEIASEIIK